MPESGKNGGQASSAEAGESIDQQEEKPECGVVMPISRMGNLGPRHWEEVRDILFGPIRKAGFRPSLVSESDEVAIIHRSIVQNLYENEVVVCDVSAKNPNVMFELGLRLAFDKPTVIVKDDETDYSFDTSPIEHLEYPRSLRYKKILDFKEKLKSKIKHTAKKAKEDDNYSPFLKHFGQYQVSGLSQEEVTEFEYLRSEIGEIRSMLSKTRQGQGEQGISQQGKPFEDILLMPLHLYARLRREIAPHLEDIEEVNVATITRAWSSFELSESLWLELVARGFVEDDMITVKGVDALMSVQMYLDAVQGKGPDLL